jgi:uncharacterized protein YciI
MKQLLVLAMVILPFSLLAQQKKEKTFKDGEYTMKQYYFVMLTKGPRRAEITDTAKIKELQRGHMANIDRLAKEGKIIVAGPFGDDSNWRGIFVFDCETKEEVEKLLQSDPAIAAGRLAYEVHPWWTAKGTTFK